MQEKINISVIIPTFNREKTIKRCIESIIGQTYPYFEIIVVDDGSTDHTLNIIEDEYAGIVRIIKQDHRGAQAARNIGIKAARGDYIAFLDSDDEWMPNKLELQIEALEKNRNAVVYSDGFIQTDWADKVPKIYDKPMDKKRKVKTGARKIYKMQGRSGYVYREILKNSFCLFQSLLTSKRNLVEIGFLDENVLSFQEWDTAIRLAEKHEFIYIKKPLFIYHLHDGETISKSTKKCIDGLEYIYEKYKYDILCQLGCKEIIQRYKTLMLLCIKYKDKRVFKYFFRYIMGKRNVYIFK